MLKRAIRVWVRRLLKIREHETIEDGISRKNKHLLKRLPHKTFNSTDFKNDLIKLGINKGDVLIVHASWLGMYALGVTPNEAIDIILDALGEDGTLVMPYYAQPSSYLDMDHLSSSAGILSEFLRKKEGVRISVFPKFSMIAYGKKAEEIVHEHIESTYQFDEHSPYYIAMNDYNAKVLLLGMGRQVHKITIFHCASYQSRYNNSFYRECFTNEKNCIVHHDGRDTTFNYIDRADNYSNNKRVFRKLFAYTKKQAIYFPGYSLTLFNAREAYNTAYDFCMNGGKIYK